MSASNRREIFRRVRELRLALREAFDPEEVRELERALALFQFGELAGDTDQLPSAIAEGLANI